MYPAQYIKLDNGVLFSSFSNEKDLEILSSERIASYSILLGADYLEKEWFYFSSQIGYQKIGGKETNPFLEGELKHISETKNFVHLNTTFRIYKRIDAVQFFVGVGPYINVLAGTKNFRSQLYESDYYYNSLNIGGKSELGVNCDINKFRMGVMGSYLLGLSPTAESMHIHLYNHGFAAMLTFGYKFK